MNADDPTGRVGSHTYSGRTLKLIAIRGGEVFMDVDRVKGLAPGPKVLCPIMSFVIDDGENVILFDTGMNPAVREDPVGYWGRIANRVIVPELPQGADILNRLRQAGYPPESITLILNSHLHNDHAGTNREYPHARVLVRQREWDHARTLMDTESSGYVRHDFHSNALNDRRADDPEVPLMELFDYEREHDVLGDGTVCLISTIGHTPGHQSLVVTFPSGRQFVLTGDVAYTSHELHSASAPVIAWNRELAAQSSSQLLALEENGATVLICHDKPTWDDIASFATIHEEPF